LSIDIDDFWFIVEGLTCERYGVRRVGTMICGSRAIVDGRGESMGVGGALKDVG
jgi:hypothetical protein